MKILRNYEVEGHFSKFAILDIQLYYFIICLWDICCLGIHPRGSPFPVVPVPPTFLKSLLLSLSLSFQISLTSLFHSYTATSSSFPSNPLSFSSPDSSLFELSSTLSLHSFSVNTDRLPSTPLLRRDSLNRHLLPCHSSQNFETKGSNPLTFSSQTISLSPCSVRHCRRHHLASSSPVAPLNPDLHRRLEPEAISSRGREISYGPRPPFFPMRFYIFR